jgi:nucleoside phosphorylase
MRELKILHTSDLLLGRPENDAAFAAVVNQLAGKLRGEVDYIVITGNLTHDGEVSSFTAAEQALGNVTERLLRRDKDGFRRNRVLIVPGRRDTRNGESYGAFKDFHDRFFEDEIKAERVDRFDDSRAAFRQLKDISLVGFCYWKNSPGDCIETMLSGIAPAGLHAAQQPMGIAYTEQTPTIIASADPIIFRGGSGEEPSFKALRAALRSSFLKAVHLFGAGDTTLPAPWTLEAIGIGTGTKWDGFWPFTANLLRIRRLSLEDRGQREHKRLSNTVYHQANAQLPLEESELFDGQLDCFYDAQPDAKHDGVYGSLLSSIEAALRENPQVIVRGFPGAGKLKFFEHMKSRNRLVNQKVQVIPRMLRRAIDEELVEGIQKELNAFRKSHRDHDVWPLVLLHDGRRARMDNVEKAGLRALNDIFNQDVYVVLLQPEDDYTVAAEKRADREAVLPFLPLEIDAVKGLVQEFSCCAPADGSLVESITGGYAGFSEMILEEGAREFSSFSGAEPMRKTIPSDMMESAFRSDRLRRESDLHCEILVRNAGADICSYIQRKVQKKRAEKTGEKETSNVLSTVTELPPIDIDVEELREYARFATQPKLASLDTRLEKLSKAGILGRKQVSAGRTTYRVAVLAPFAASDLGAPAATPGHEEPWPELTDADLEKQADVVIITALAMEQEAVLRKLRTKRQVDASEDDTLVYHFSNVPVTFPSGKKTTYRVVVTTLVQMGQVDAALAAAAAIQRWGPRAVLLVGIAGGVSSNGVAIGDVLVADQVAYYDEQKIRDSGTEIRWRMIPTDPRLLSAARNFSVESASRWFDVERPAEGKPALHFGPVATGNKVIATVELLGQYTDIHPKLVGVEMEAWGVAMASFQAARPRRFFMIRGVSDLADAAKDSKDVEAWRSYACDAAASYAIALLQGGPLPDATREGDQR